MKLNSYIDRLKSGEDFMLKRLFSYASEAEYKRYLSTREEAWQMILRGPSLALIEYLERHDKPDPIHVDEEFEKNASIAFGVLEAKRHRERGIRFDMFLGFAKLVRQVFIDLVYETDLSDEQRKVALAITHRFFDKFELGFCTEWTRTQENDFIKELQNANWRMSNEKSQAEKALRRNETSFRNIIERNADAIIIIDKNGMVRFANTAAETLFAKKADSLLGRPFGFPLVSGETIEIQVLTGYKKPSIAEMRVMETEWEGERAFIASLRDVTERKNLEEQLRQSQKMEAVGRLAGGVAHDFNNILTGIIGFADLTLMQFDPDHQLRKNIEEIKKSGDLAAALIRQLLAFSRHQVVHPRVIELNTVVSDFDKMLRRLIGEDVELETALASELGRVEADPGQMEQVIMNLAINAKDAMPNGGRLTIETANVILDEAYTRKHVAVTPGPYVMLAISDNGTGMDEEVRSHIFEPFFTTKEEGKGTGLGLSTVYGIVKQSGGNIWVYSEIGKGTTFKIYLPRVDKKPETAKAVKVTRGSLNGTETILVVEDNEMVRHLTVEILQKYGYKILASSHGEEALAKSDQTEDTIHLIVTDVVMPGMNGQMLAKRLKIMRPEIKVLYISGYTDNAMVHQGVLDRGAFFLQKPFTPGALAGKVRGVLDS